MNLLIDTHLLMIAAFDADRLGPDLTRLLMNPAHKLWFSAASICEIALRCGTEDLGPGLDPAAFRSALLANGYDELPIEGRHCTDLAALPRVAFFARVLVSQAAAESMMLLTNDPDLGDVTGPVRYFALR